MNRVSKDTWAGRYSYSLRNQVEVEASIVITDIDLAEWNRQIAEREAKSKAEQEARQEDKEKREDK